MNNKKGPVQQEKEPEKIKQAMMFASSFFALLKAESLYPKRHKMPVLAMERFCYQLKNMLDKDKSVSLRIFDNNLYCQKVLLDPGNIPDVVNFIEKLHERYVRQIIFNEGSEIPDVEALIKLLMTAPEEISPEAGTNGFLEQYGAKNVKTVEYYHKVRSGESRQRASGLSSDPIMEFFAGDESSSLSTEQAYSLYEMLKETPLICALIKEASKNRDIKQAKKIPENVNILEIIKKIKDSIDKLNISEESEIKTIFHDIITSNSDEDYFNVVFENQNDELINFSNASASMFDKLGAQKTAEFMTRKIKESNGDLKVIAGVKSILVKLKDHNDMKDFIPVFKDMLAKDIFPGNKAKQIMNDVCSLIDPEYVPEMDNELSLGLISESESGHADISAGFNVLNDVHPEKEAMAERIYSFDQNQAYIAVLEELIKMEKIVIVFSKMVNRLNEQINMLFDQNKPERALEVTDFFFNLTSDPEGISQDYKKIVFESLAELPAEVLEKLVNHILSLQDDRGVQTAFKQLFYMLPLSFITFLIKFYINNEIPGRDFLFREAVASNYRASALKFNIDLRNAPVLQIMRFMDILRDINNDEILPLLWEITFRENILIAQKSLQLIASKKSDKAISFLLKAMERPEIPLRITGIECLGGCGCEKARFALAEAAQGRAGMTDDPSANIDIRIAALKSMELLDAGQAVKIFKEILRKKKFLFIYIEPKKLRIFAAERLKNYPEESDRRK